MLFSCPCFYNLFIWPFAFLGLWSFYFLLFLDPSCSFVRHFLFHLLLFLFFSCLFRFKYSGHAWTLNWLFLYKMRTADYIFSVVLVLWGQMFLHNQATIPHKLNEARGLARYLEHIQMCPFPFGLCNGVEYGMGAPYSPILREPTKSESKLTWCY